MAGHSEWANRKYDKRKADRRRAKKFSKLSRKIIRAAREGGGDPEKNVELKWAIEEAREADMPKENIERAIKKGTGELEDQAPRETVFYEGFAPGNVGVLVVALTENRNRTHADVNQIFDEHNGSLADAGSVKHLFESRACFRIEKDGYSADQILELAIDAGAEEVREEEDRYEIFGSTDRFESIRNQLSSSNVTLTEARYTHVPRTRVNVGHESRENLQSLKEELLDYRDVEEVFTNLEQTNSS